MIKAANIIDINRAENIQPLAADSAQLPKMKTLKEMSELTGLPYAMLRNLCIQNKIVYIRTGKKYLINYDRFIDFLNQGQ